MLIPINYLAKFLEVRPTGVLHVGAHNGEEAISYKKYNWGKIIWIEAQKELVQNLLINLDRDSNKVIHAAAWSVNGALLTFNLASNGQSSSLLEMGTHAKSYPEITVVDKYQVTTSRLDSVLTAEDKFDFVNLDVQGAELEVLIGLGEYLLQTNWIYTEVNKEEVYRNCAKVNQMDEFLLNQGFVRMSTRWAPFKGWGDALYIRREIQVPFAGRVTIWILNYIWSAKENSKAIVKKLQGKLHR